MSATDHSKPRRGRSLRLFAWLVLWLVATPALGHPLGTSVTIVTVEPAATRAEVNLAAEDLERAIGSTIYDREAASVPPERLAALLPTLQAYLGDRVALRSAHGPCPPDPVQIETEGHVIRAHLAWRCGADFPGLVLESRLLAGTDERYVQHVRVERGGELFEALLRDGRTEVDLVSPTDPWRVGVEYVRSGVEHIFIGIDHIAFLIGLLLWATRILPVVKVVTAFTLAHTVTLSLAVLDLVQVPARIVEPLIALTVIWVAVENFLSRDIEHRWRLAMALGLIHGFGFASVLQEYGLPPGAVGLALGAFNVGVELGQLGIVALLMPTLWALDRLWPVRAGEALRQPALVYAPSSVLALLGAWWLAERTIL